LKNKFDRTGLPGLWSWPDLWWKAPCGCKGYGGLIILSCHDPEDQMKPNAIQLTPCRIDMDNETIGKLTVIPLTLKEKVDIIAMVGKEFALGRLAREVLKTMREIGKLT